MIPVKQTFTSRSSNSSPESAVSPERTGVGRIEGKIRVFSGNAGKPLAEKACEHLGIEPAPAKVETFGDGEVKIELGQSVRNAHVFIINPTNPPAENLLELILLADAAARASAGSITVIPTYLGYNRQDRKDKPRVPLSAKVAVQMLSIPSIDRAILLDPHSDPTEGFFDDGIVVDRLYSSFVSKPYLQELLTDDFAVASPDKGGGPRAEAYARRLGLDDYVLFTKSRPESGAVDKELIKIIGEVEGKDVLLIDDMIDTGGTIVADAEAAREAGARRIYVFATHALFSGDAVANIDKSALTEVIVTDSVHHDPERLRTHNVPIKVISVAPLIAEAIQRIMCGQPMSELFV